ncbi:hypothetical protein AUR64_00935 [Haloprofundus marisrubri]|uniref:Uncharacterized protein n=1 Tax=Haloprofundus marisrubri TaxID=1514971 RepID=A0A0W1R439_9EURY|nr:hypothetical protein [Haloprofundus marisrubri]KTG08169.1 hypothetical protein AUR64_00935 [Haloprofundus marisrubri]
MSSSKVTLTFALVLLCTAFAPGVAGALAADAPLDVDVAHDDTEVTVTVTQNATTVQNATVNVTADGNYSGEGTYATGENGSVVLPEPDSPTNVTLNVTYGSLETTESVELAPSTSEGLSVSVSQDDGGEPTVSVTDNGTAVPNATVDVAAEGNYSGLGTYTTGENGSVSLPEPDENVTVTVTATTDNDTVETTANLTVADEEPMSFGQRVSSFVQSVLGDDGEGGIGQVVSEFVRGNNPGKADEKRPDHAGPPADKGKNADRGNQSKVGNGNGHGAEKGDDHPSNANGKNVDDESDETDETDEKNENGQNGQNGKKGSNGNGNGNGGDSPELDNGPAVDGPTVPADA